MADYDKGKIYMISNEVTNLKYIGSTTLPLNIRFNRHKTHSKQGLTKLCKEMGEFGSEFFEIELLEKFPCDNKLELETREGEYIIEYDTINNGYNANQAGRTHKESCRASYLKHREERLSYMKDYHFRNGVK